MSRNQNRRRLSVQPLETRKLMAGDAFTITGVDDAIVDGNQTSQITIAAGQTTSAAVAGGSAGLHVVNNGDGSDFRSDGVVDAADFVLWQQNFGTDATDAVMSRLGTMDIDDFDSRRS